MALHVDNKQICALTDNHPIGITNERCLQAVQDNVLGSVSHHVLSVQACQKAKQAVKLYQIWTVTHTQTLLCD